tara:strand:- start:1553 stop:1744 length:192 start_codon:yes stop_codon:yes gene_type:complete
MKIKELIKQLKDQDPEMEVIVLIDNLPVCDLFDVGVRPREDFAGDDLLFDHKDEFFFVIPAGC